MTEFSSEVLFLTYDESKGSFTQQQAVSTIPADFTENNQGVLSTFLQMAALSMQETADITSQLQHFKVDQDSGQLTFIEWTGTRRRLAARFCFRSNRTIHCSV